VLGTYFTGNTLPAWQITREISGATPDFSTGWTFVVKRIDVDGTATTCSATVTGAAGGVITVAWAPTDLATPGRYRIQCTATQSGSGNQITTEDTIEIKAKA